MSTSNTHSTNTTTPIADLQTPGIEDVARIISMFDVLVLCLSAKRQAIRHLFLAVSCGPGRFRELREVCWNHFRSWYVSDSVVPTYGQHNSHGVCFVPSAVFGVVLHKRKHGCLDLFDSELYVVISNGIL